MAKAHPATRAGARPGRRDWRRAMSDNVACALLVYTALQIFVTMKAIKGTSNGSILPYLALIVLVALIIPACRRFEKRWEAIGDEHAGDLALRPRFRRDQMLLWLLAIGLPFVLTAIFRVIGGLL